MNRERHHILLVDDCRMNRMIVASALPAATCVIHEAADGLAALRAVGELERVDLIFLDLVMPVLDGLDTLAALRADCRTANIPIVIVSALDEPDDIALGMEMGADAFLTLPLEPQQIAGVAREILDRQSAPQRR